MINRACLDYGGHKCPPAQVVCELTEAAVSNYPTNGPFSFVSFPNRRARRAKSEDGTARVPRRECRRFRVAALYRDCLRADARGERQAGAARWRKNYNRASRRQNLVSRWPPRYPSLGPAVRTRAACSLGLCRAL